MARKQKVSVALTAVLVIIGLVLGVAVGAGAAVVYDSLTFQSDEAPKTVVQGELQIHFLELGNK